MQKFIVIKADTNDADYIHGKCPITDEEIEAIKPVIEQLKARRDKLNDDRHKNWNKWRHNWENSEYGGRCGTPKEMYVDTGLLTQEQVDLFEEFVPYGESGVHTIESVEIVLEGEKLF